MPSKDSSDEDMQGDDDDSDNGDVTMDIDSTKHPEETQPVALMKTVTEVKAPAPVLVADKTKEDPFFQVFKYRSNSNKTGLVWNDGETEHVAIMKWRMKCWKM
ncbi:hypothetical protein C0995_008685 [Termitomyces sp. Mi166|nr:hypothetical protein C0995_008685 [Termitomyces sp. Mi166\